MRSFFCLKHHSFLAVKMYGAERAQPASSRESLTSVVASGEAALFINGMVWGVLVTSGLVDRAITRTAHTELAHFLPTSISQEDFRDVDRFEAR